MRLRIDTFINPFILNKSLKNSKNIIKSLNKVYKSLKIYGNIVMQS